MKYLIATLKILVGIFFIFSGYSKLFPIEPFEFIFVEKGILNWVTASFVSRLIISAEISMGLMLLFSQKTKIVSVLAMVMLVVFTGYLFYDWLVLGNNEDCGCMGDWIKFSNTESILKNGVLILFLFLIFKYDTMDWSRWWAWLVLCLAPGTTVFIINTVTFTHSYIYNPKEVVTLEYDKFPAVNNLNDSVYYQKGEHILAMFSTQCPHCRIAAQKLALMEKRVKMPEITVFYLGSDSSVAVFQKESKNKLNYVKTLDEELFFNQNKGIIPCIYHLKDGKVINRWYEVFVIEKEFE